MKQHYLLVLVLCLAVFSCKPKNSTKSTSTDSTTLNKNLTLPDLNKLSPNNNNNNNTSSGSWSQDYRSKFLSGCISKASESVTLAAATSYCECMAAKVELKYPVETEVDSKLTSADIDVMKVGCNASSQSQNNNQSNSGSWSYAVQKQFMDDCIPAASSSLGQVKATTYCDCMMTKLMQEYPNSEDAVNMPKNRMSQLATECR